MYVLEGVFLFQGRGGGVVFLEMTGEAEKRGKGQDPSNDSCRLVGLSLGGLRYCAPADSCLDGFFTAKANEFVFRPHL